MSKGGSSLDRALGRQEVAVNFLSAALRKADLHHLHAAANAGQEIVKVVSKPSRQLADRLHLL